jgi:hypothetical protein
MFWQQKTPFCLQDKYRFSSEFQTAKREQIPPFMGRKGRIQAECDCKILTGVWREPWPQWNVWLTTPLQTASKTNRILSRPWYHRRNLEWIYGRHLQATTRPPGKAHWLCGSLHMSSGLYFRLLILFQWPESWYGPAWISPVKLSTFEVEVRSCQESVVLPSFRPFNWCQINHLKSYKTPVERQILYMAN